MKLVDILEKAFSKMPNGWGETVKVDLTTEWTVPCDGILQLSVVARGDVAYVGSEKNTRYICAYAYGGGNTTTAGIVRKGENLKITYKGRNVTTVECIFTPFSYRGGYLSRLVNFLQSLTFKEVIA